MPAWLFNSLRETAAVEKLNNDQDGILLSSLCGEALNIAASFTSRPRGIIVLKADLYSAQLLYERLAPLLNEEAALLFACEESLRVEAIASSPENRAGRVDTLAKLLTQPASIVVASVAGFLRLLPRPEVFQRTTFTLTAGQKGDMGKIREALTKAGYRRVSHIDQPLTFAQRGGIIDIWPINYEKPVRAEFFADEIETLRFFDENTQKTIEQTNAVTIIPASEVLFTEEDAGRIAAKAAELAGAEIPAAVERDLESIASGQKEERLYPYMALCEKTASLIDYMNDPQIVISDPEAVKKAVRSLYTETTAYIQEMVQEQKLLPRFALFNELDRLIKNRRTVTEEPFADEKGDFSELYLPEGTLETKLKLINDDEKAVLALAEKELAIVTQILAEGGRPYRTMTGEDEVKPGLNLTLLPLRQGFYLNNGGIAVYTANELLGQSRITGRYEKKFRAARIIHDYDELSVGDYIVHAQYGVGQYLGIINKQVNNVCRDFLSIAYRGGASLLVPLEQFRLVRKFVGREGAVPRLNKLGTSEWEKTRSRLKKNADDIAARLLDLYASRQAHTGYAFAKDSEMAPVFENAFPYELTGDQKEAVAAIKKDMENDTPMDRLLCGDVGFGKTEVAVRAAFKAVSDNKQVAFLCPTTILCQQHFRTFRERFAGWPVEIRALNRFSSKAEQAQTVSDLKAGKVDIVIGTHRLLSADIGFKDLGLLIIDEEQRFGVSHKERLKEMKRDVDVLALSATPIPRTLEMSLVNIRQLSLLEEPPLNRYGTATYVVEKNDGLIRSAIGRELARGGQVYYLHNSVETIGLTAAKLKELLPEARIAVCHGQMDGEAIEEVMTGFINRQSDVLVCTTIMENGIDIPNVNTVLVDAAQDFGLSQLYQIKGRVGRGDRVAYAYLLIPPRRQLSETAAKRLQALKEFAALGSGYRIAMRDLTIRGAGDLLGSEQSGFIDTVGIDMYIEMLNEAIAARKEGVTAKEEPPVYARVNKSAYIPENFTADDYDRLAMYQKIEKLSSLKELREYEEEVTDRYGRLYEPVRTLFDKKYLDILLKRKQLHKYQEVANRCEITFSKEFSERVDGAKLFELFMKINRDVTLRYRDGMITAALPIGKDALKTAIALIERAGEALKHEN